MIPIKDIYWAAGFLDGEGTFVYKKTNSSVVVSAPQKGRELLDKLVYLFGGHVYDYSPRIYQWQLTGEKAAGLMMTLYSLMSVKRKAQIVKALSGWKSAKLSPSKHIALFGKCKNDHDWTEANIVVEKDGHKRCRICLETRSRAYSKIYYISHKETIKEQSKVNKHNRKLIDSSGLGIGV